MPARLPGVARHAHATGGDRHAPRRPAPAPRPATGRAVAMLDDPADIDGPAGPAEPARGRLRMDMPGHCRPRGWAGPFGTLICTAPRWPVPPEAGARPGQGPGSCPAAAPARPMRGATLCRNRSGARPETWRGRSGARSGSDGRTGPQHFPPRAGAWRRACRADLPALQGSILERGLRRADLQAVQGPGLVEIRHPAQRWWPPPPRGQMIRTGGRTGCERHPRGRMPLCHRGLTGAAPHDAARARNPRTAASGIRTERPLRGDRGLGPGHRRQFRRRQRSGVGEAGRRACAQRPSGQR